MSWLITGGCGFVGSNLAAEVIKNDDLVIIDNLSRCGSNQNKSWLEQIATKSKHKIKFYIGDVGDLEFMDSVFTACGSRIKNVAHLAGQVAMTTSLSDPLRDFRTNALGSFLLLECIRKYCPEAAVMYSSTNKVYGDLEYLKYQETETRYITPEYVNGFDESLPLDFSTPYGCSKGSADQYIKDWSRSYGLKTVVFRHSSMYGGRQFATYDQGWIGWFCQQAVQQKRDPQVPPFSISGNGKQVRDVLYCDDLVRLYTMAAENIDNIKGEIFNIGGGMGNSLSLLELFSCLEKIVDVNLNFYNKEWRKSDQKVFVANIDKAYKMIQWKPSVNYHDGIAQMLDWIKSGCNS